MAQWFARTRMQQQKNATITQMPVLESHAATATGKKQSKATISEMEIQGAMNPLDSGKGTTHTNTQK